jgi:putative membrane protein
MRRVSVNPSTLLQGVILLCFTAFLIRLFATHAIYMLVSPLIATIVKASLPIFAIITIVSLVSGVSVRKTAHSADRDHDRHHPHNHHHVSLNSRWGRATVTLLFVSLGLAFTWHPKALGTDMIAEANTGSRASSTSATSATAVTNGTQSAQNTSQASYSADDASYYASVDDAVIQKPGELSAAQIAVDWDQNKARYLGHNVTIEGFVYHPPGLPANDFIITRYFIFCCIADAAPLGVAVESPIAATLKNDEWVSVSGVMQNQTLPTLLNQYDPTNWYPQNHTQPVIVAKSVKRIPVPKLPYMVPNY